MRKACESPIINHRAAIPLSVREDADLKQRDVAEYLHCSQQVYSNYELGQRDIPTAVLIALAEFHHTNVDYLLGLTSVRTYYMDLETHDL